MCKGLGSKSKLNTIIADPLVLDPMSSIIQLGLELLWQTCGKVYKSQLAS